LALSAWIDAASGVPAGALEEAAEPLGLALLDDWAVFESPPHPVRTDAKRDAAATVATVHLVDGRRKTRR
jgi:hypothetical protein